MKGIAQTSSSAANQVRRLETQGGAGTPLHAATASRQERRLKIPTCLERNPSFGNRTSTKAGGDQNGQNLRPASYTVNNANQYASRRIPSAFDVVGIANTTASVTVNSAAVDYRRGEYFRKKVTVANTAVAVWQSVAVATSGGGSSSGNVFVPKNSETFAYDLDGNLYSDGRWTYTWDVENRMTKVESVSSLPNAAKRKLEFGYDNQGRRIWSKISTNNGNYVVSRNTRFVYDGWNLVAELNATNNAPQRTYLWGNDLSGTLDGAGGIGGLVLIRDYASGTSYFPAYDGNGNVTALVNAADQTISAQYEYSPFGELIRATGPMAKANPFRFSTKYWDEETGLVCYPSRYYNPALGRWLGRDPIEEQGGNNLYAFVGNNPANEFDPLGESSGTLTDEEGAISGGEIMEGGEGASQALSIYSRIKEAVNTYSEIQDFISNASDIIDMLDGGSGELLAQLMSLGNSSFSQGLKKDRTTYLYDKIGGNGEHLKYGVTYDLNKRYSARELGTGRLKVLAQGKRKAMLALERALHSTLPLGSEEKQKAYWLIQKAKGYSNK